VKHIARTFEEAINGVLPDLLRFATYRAIGFEVDRVAEVMCITSGLAERYETAITRLMADLQSEAAPDAPGAAPDPHERNHRV
jgi:hypothetical protein